VNSEGKAWIVGDERGDAPCPAPDPYHGERVDRIAHLQRRARLQRRVIERLAGRHDRDPLGDARALIAVLEELEDRNLVLEDAIRTARAQISSAAASGAPAVLDQDVTLDACGMSIGGDQAAWIHAKRLEAERLRAEGDFKSARRLLRLVSNRKALAGSGLQTLANSRYRFLRALFSFYRYR
jgi:hypothetical protein